MVAMPCCGQCANLGFGDSSEDGVSRLTNRVTMANRKVADNPRISTPINAIGFSPGIHPAHTARFLLPGWWSKEELSVFSLNPFLQRIHLFKRFPGVPTPPAWEHPGNKPAASVPIQFPEQTISKSVAMRPFAPTELTNMPPGPLVAIWSDEIGATLLGSTLVATQFT
jgi:hypothetical protein